MTTQEMIERMTELQTRSGAPLPVTVDMFQNVVQIITCKNPDVGVSRGLCVDVRTDFYAVKCGMDRDDELAQETVKEVIGALREITGKQSQIIAQLKIACETNDIGAVLAGARRLTGLDDSTP